MELKSLKEQNKRILNKQAAEFTECSECENLFLDAVDCCRKDVVKRQIESLASSYQLLHISSLKDKGLSGQMLMEAVCTKKDDLIFMFENIFGSQKMK